MSAGALNARALTGRLIARTSVECGVPADDVGVVIDTCERTAKLISRSLGTTGFQALASRAIASQAVHHSLLKEISLGNPHGLFLGGVAVMVQRHSEQAVARGLEAALEAMLELLGKLIGIDMVASLVDRSEPGETQDEEA